MAAAEGGTVSPDEILAAFQRNVRRLDNWRGYIGDDEDSPSDDEVHEVLQRARDCMATVGKRTQMAFMLDLVPAEALDDVNTRIAELERQRDAVLALHQQIPGDPTKCGICHQANQSCGCCGSWDENDRWPCKTVEIYGGGQ